MSRSFTLGDIVEERFDAGGLDSALTVRRTGSATAHDVDVEFTDVDGVAGTHPYYVRGQQDVGDVAWSSPIFVTRGNSQ